MLPSILSSVAGAAVGGLMGGKGQKSSQSSAPVMPDNVRKAYDMLIDRSSELSSQPYRDITRTRVEPNTMYGGIFNNPEMQAIQQASDARAFQNAGFPSEEEMRKIGKDYFKNYGQKSGVNPAFFNTLNGQNMDYMGIARALLDTQNKPETFGVTNEYLKSLGLGYSPESMPHGVKIPTRGIPGYN